jgi:hypothetical protein
VLFQNTAALLGGGPYGPSDGPFYSNRSLIMTTTRTDGLLLRADKPITTMDAAFQQVSLDRKITQAYPFTWVVY